MKHWFTALSLCLILGLGLVMPSTSQAATAWQDLSVSEQQILAKHRKHWAELPESRRQGLRQRAARIEAMSPEQRQRLEKRREEYKRLPADERRALKQKWENMPPEERRAAKERWQRND